MQLTTFGGELVSKAEQILGLVDNISDLAHCHQTSKDHPLLLGLTPTLAVYLSRYLRGVFAQIAEHRKIIVVEEYPAVLARMVEERAIDIAFVSRNSFDALFEGAKQPLSFTSLWLEPVFLAVRTGHPLASRDSIWADQVPADYLIRFGTSFGYDPERDLPMPSAHAAETTGIDAKNARFETVCRYVAQSDACTIVNAVAAEQFKSDGFGLAFIPFDDEGNMRELGVLTRPNYPHPEMIVALRDSISDRAPAGTIASQDAAIGKTPVVVSG